MEKDILSTVTKYKEKPFDRTCAEKVIIENNLKYPDVSAAIKMVPEIRVIPFTEVSDEDVLNNLKMQIEAMSFKEYSIIKN